MTKLPPAKSKATLPEQAEQLLEKISGYARTGRMESEKYAYGYLTDFLTRIDPKVLLERHNGDHTFLMDAINLPFIGKVKNPSMSEKKALKMFNRLVTYAKKHLTPEQYDDLFMAWNEDERTLLHFAARNGNLAVYKAVRDAFRELPHAADEETALASLLELQDAMGFTPLHHAIASGNAELVDTMLYDLKTLAPAGMRREVLLLSTAEKNNIFHLAAREVESSAQMTAALEKSVKEAFGDEGKATLAKLYAAENDKGRTPRDMARPSYLQHALKPNPRISSLITRT